VPCLKTWQSLADFKYPGSSLEYQPPTINVADIGGTPPQLLKIYYPINFRKKELLARTQQPQTDFKYPMWPYEIPSRQE